MKTFLLGTGCQKGGTTWLFQYLKASPQYVTGFRKEYHVFDAIDIPGQAYRRDEITEAAEATLARGREGKPVNAQVMLLAAMQANPEFYFDYFSGLLMTRPEGRVTADVTPSYGMLSAERLTGIQQAFAERGVRTATVFLMRDPVDRVLSQMRMQVRRKSDRFRRPLAEVLLLRHAMPGYAARTAYDQTISVVDEAFDPADVYYGFYENLFNEDRIREICALLGMDFHPPKLDVRANASPPVQDVPEETLRVVAESYRPVYEAVGRRFPDVDLEALWPYSRLLG
jgi:hypothetical protein